MGSADFTRCMIPCMVSGVPGVWVAAWRHGLVFLGMPPFCKCCFSGGYFGDCTVLEKDTLALLRSYHYQD